MTYYVKQMNNGHWYVLRTAGDGLPALKCENAGWPTKRDAESAINREVSRDIEISPGQIWRDADHPGRFVLVVAVTPNLVSLRTCDAKGNIVSARTTKAAYYRFAFVAGQRTGAGYRLVAERNPV
jgi:hypothetical protein